VSKIYTSPNQNGTITKQMETGGKNVRWTPTGFLPIDHDDDDNETKLEY